MRIWGIICLHTLLLPLHAFCTCVSIEEVKQCQTSARCQIVAAKSACQEFCANKMIVCTYNVIYTLYELKYLKFVIEHLCTSNKLMQWLTQFWKIPKLASLKSLCTYGRGALLG